MLTPGGQIAHGVTRNQWVGWHAVGGAAGGLVGNVVDQAVRGEGFNLGEAVFATGMGAVTGAAGALGSWARFKDYCFAAGTPLLVPGGSKLIERIRPGDRVLCRGEYDPDGPVEARVVEEVFVQIGRLFRLRAGGKVIGTTAEHRFWVRGRGWTPAADLEPGQQMRSHDGQWVVVEGVEQTDEYVTLYNLRVAEHHTYFVGCEDWGFSVWAHNSYTSDAEGRRAEQRLGDRLNERRGGPGAGLPEEVKGRLQMYGKHSYVEGETGNAWSDYWTPDRLRQLKTLSSPEEMLAAVDQAARAVKGPGQETLMRQIEIETENRGKPWGDPRTRPDYAAGQEEAVWNAAAAKDPQGKVFDPETGQELFWDRTRNRFDQWHMGHREFQKYEVWHRKYLDGELTLDQFLGWYRNPANYQPELPGSNMRNNQKVLP
jgi:hypothetical protein